MNTFHWLDYVVLAVVLLGSLCTGIYFACSGGKQKTTGEYFRGNKQLSVIPAAMSIMVSYISGILIIGLPAEVFLYGGMHILSCVGVGLGAILAALIYVPMFYPLGLTSINTYLQMRFNSRIPQLMCTAANIVFTLCYTGLVIYAPSTTISVVTGIPTPIVILVSAIVVIIYTSIGGLKAVIWTDAFQCVAMFAGVLAVTVKGMILAGGFSKTMNYVYEGGRMDIWDFDVNPHKRLTFWTMVPCSTFAYFLLYGATQTTLQRYCGLPTIRQAKLSMILVALFVIAINITTLLAGFALYGYYSTLGCDPLSQGIIDNPNQLLPYFVMETMNYPGVPGIFVSAMCAGGLSSASSVLNSASANTWVDILKPHLPNVTEAKATMISKLIVVLYGGLSIAMAFAVMMLGGTVIQVSLSFNGSVLVVVTGTIFFAALCPWANWKGAVVGGIVGFSFVMWLACGSYMVKKYATDMLPLITHGCTNNNLTLFDNSTTNTFESINEYTTSPATYTSDNVIEEDSSWFAALYGVSFYWYKPYGCAIILIVGSAVSLLTRRKTDHDADPALLFQCIRKSCCFSSGRRSAHGENNNEEKMQTEAML